MNFIKWMAAKCNSSNAKLLKNRSWNNWLRSTTTTDLNYLPSLGAESKQALFKKNIRLVELEPNSFCNRTCWFCPNSIVDRITPKHSLDKKLFNRVINDLVSIDYDHVIRFARYSEPTAFLKPLCEMIQATHRALPKASIDVITNGDYLKPETLNQLSKSGLHILRISIYPDNQEGSWTPAAAIEKMQKLGERIQISPTQIKEKNNSVSCLYEYDQMSIVAWSHDFNVKGFDRGESLKVLKDEGFARRSPCRMVFENFTIEYDGTVMPCCNLRSDVPGQEKYKIDSLKTDDERTIFDIYANKTYASWRKSLVNVEIKDTPCRTCKQKAVTDENDLAELDLVWRSHKESLGI